MWLNPRRLALFRFLLIYTFLMSYVTSAQFNFHLPFKPFTLYHTYNLSFWFSWCIVLLAFSLKILEQLSELVNWLVLTWPVSLVWTWLCLGLTCPRHGQVKNLSLLSWLSWHWEKTEKTWKSNIIFCWWIILRVMTVDHHIIPQGMFAIPPLLFRGSPSLRCDASRGSSDFGYHSSDENSPFRPDRLFRVGKPAAFAPQLTYCNLMCFPILMSHWVMNCINWFLRESEARGRKQNDVYAWRFECGAPSFAPRHVRLSPFSRIARFYLFFPTLHSLFAVASR